MLTNSNCNKNNRRAQSSEKSHSTRLRANSKNEGKPSTGNKTYDSTSKPKLSQSLDAKSFDDVPKFPESCSPSSKVTMTTEHLSTLIRHAKSQNATIFPTMSAELNHDSISNVSSIPSFTFSLDDPHASLPDVDAHVKNTEYTPLQDTPGTSTLINPLSIANLNSLDALCKWQSPEALFLFTGNANNNKRNKMKSKKRK